MIKDLLLITPTQTRGQSCSYKNSWSPIQVSMVLPDGPFQLIMPSGSLVSQIQSSIIFMIFLHYQSKLFVNLP